MTIQKGGKEGGGGSIKEQVVAKLDECSALLRRSWHVGSRRDNACGRQKTTDHDTKMSLLGNRRREHPQWTVEKDEEDPPTEQRRPSTSMKNLF